MAQLRCTNVAFCCNGCTPFSVDGANGRLLEVTDDLSCSIFSANTIAGLPVIEAFANYCVVMGQYGGHQLQVTCTSIRGGRCTTASGAYSFVGGGCCNVASGINSTLGGGGANATYGAVGNTASGNFSFLGGGHNNTASGYASMIAGGITNLASSFYSTISGGYSNTASAVYSAIAGGRNNLACNSRAFIGGGHGNCATGQNSTVGGGGSNAILATSGNRATGDGSSVLGGGNNCATGYMSAIGGGLGNIASGYLSVVAGGGGIVGLSPSGNKAYGTNTFVGGGYNNCAGDTTGGGTGAVVAGGYNNTASGYYSFIGGGRYNYAQASYTTVSGGYNNDLSTTSAYGFIGGGQANGIYSSKWSSIIGGFCNKIYGTALGTNNVHIIGSCIQLNPPSPNYTYVNNLCQTGGGLSDCRVKNTIQPLEFGLDHIAQLQPVSFCWNGDSSCHKKYGFIAQNVQQAMSCVVTCNKLHRLGDNGTQVLGDQGEPLLEFEKDAVYASYVNAFKELKAENDALKQRITAIENILKNNNLI